MPPNRPGGRRVAATTAVAALAGVLIAVPAAVRGRAHRHRFRHGHPGARIARADRDPRHRAGRSAGGRDRARRCEGRLPAGTGARRLRARRERHAAARSRRRGAPRRARVDRARPAPARLRIAKPAAGSCGRGRARCLHAGERRDQPGPDRLRGRRFRRGDRRVQRHGSRPHRDARRRPLEQPPMSHGPGRGCARPYAGAAGAQAAEVQVLRSVDPSQAQLHPAGHPDPGAVAQPR